MALNYLVHSAKKNQPTIDRNISFSDSDDSINEIKVPIPRSITSKRQYDVESPGDDDDEEESSLPRRQSFSDFVRKASFVPDGAQSSVAATRVHTSPKQSISTVPTMAQRISRRLIFKNGGVNVRKTNIQKLKRRYLADFFTTMIDLKWRWNFGIFIASFVGSWIIFASIWLGIANHHGDLTEKNIKAAAEDKFKPCVTSVISMRTALLFSIETQHTIGYGSRYVTDACSGAIILLMFQSCFGVIIQAMMTGIIFAKLARAKKRKNTLMFSKNAIISKRDDQLCLIVRIGDMRKTHLVEAHCRALLIKNKVTKEGEVLPLYQHELDIGFDEGRDRVLMACPIQVYHLIDNESPLWKVSKDDLMNERFELVFTLEGIIESTGMTMQARTSYLPFEILWGHRFRKLMQYQKEDGSYWIDYSRFQETVKVDNMPTCSAKDLEKLVAMEKVDEEIQEAKMAARPKELSPNLSKFIQHNNTIQTRHSFGGMDKPRPVIQRRHNFKGQNTLDIDDEY